MQRDTDKYEINRITFLNSVDDTEHKLVTFRLGDKFNTTKPFVGYGTIDRIEIVDQKIILTMIKPDGYVVYGGISNYRADYVLNRNTIPLQTLRTGNKK